MPCLLAVRCRLTPLLVKRRRAAYGGTRRRPVIEETLARYLLLRAIEWLAGSGVAVAVTALLFGAGHVAVAAAIDTLPDALLYAVPGTLAGVLFAGAYLLTRTLTSVVLAVACAVILGAADSVKPPPGTHSPRHDRASPPSSARRPNVTSGRRQAAEEREGTSDALPKAATIPVNWGERRWCWAWVPAQEQSQSVEDGRGCDRCLRPPDCGGVVGVAVVGQRG